MGGTRLKGEVKNAALVQARFGCLFCVSVEELSGRQLPDQLVDLQPGASIAFVTPWVAYLPKEEI